MILAGAAGAAETYRLERNGEWKNLTDKDKYLSAIANIKQLVSMGQTKEVKKALEQLKKDFPETAGPDLEAFMKAEMLFAKGKYTKAVRSYDAFMSKYPESGLYEAALDREFAIATAYLGGEKRTVLGIFRIRGYEEGEKIMDKIIDRAGNTPIAEKAALSVAQSYEKRKKFNEAYLRWSDISSRWPSGQIGKDALLAMARCKHAAYRGPKYDGSGLVSAKSYYENFQQRYPKDAEELKVAEKLKQINEQLAYKQYETGRYYERTGNVQQANFYYQMVSNEWPQSTAAKMIENAKTQNSEPKKDKTREG
jgi:outer membrane protein assembly factor BamD (BamD/ComL family)